MACWLRLVPKRWKTRNAPSARTMGMVAALSMAVAVMARAAQVVNPVTAVHVVRAKVLVAKASLVVMARVVNNAVPVALVKAANVMVRAVMAATVARVAHKVARAAKAAKVVKVARVATPPRVEDVAGRGQCRAPVALP